MVRPSISWPFVPSFAALALFGSSRIPIHCYEGVDDSPELAKRVEKRIFGGVE
jgi:hypothetical protein